MLNPLVRKGKKREEGRGGTSEFPIELKKTGYLRSFFTGKRKKDASESEARCREKKGREKGREGKNSFLASMEAKKRKALNAIIGLKNSSSRSSQRRKKGEDRATHLL